MRSPRGERRPCLVDRPLLVGRRPGWTDEQLADGGHHGRELPRRLRADNQHPADQRGEQARQQEQEPRNPRDGREAQAEGSSQAVQPSQRHRRRDGGDGPPEAVGHRRRRPGVEPVAEPPLGLALVHLVTSGRPPSSATPRSRRA